MNLFEEHHEDIENTCQQHRVSRLYVFGSALTPKFNSKSDIDFVVDFQPIELYDYADNYFDLKESLNSIFNREIDLLEEQAIKNPFLRKAIDQSKLLIYGQ